MTPGLACALCYALGALTAIDVLVPLWMWLDEKRRERRRWVCKGWISELPEG